MRTYFDFNLKGREIFPYMVVGWVLIAGILIFYQLWTQAHPQSVYFDTDMLIGITVAMLAGAAFSLISLLLTFFMMRFTLKALTLAGDGFECDYDIREYGMIVFKGSLLSAVTFGIYYPWLLAKTIRYFSSNTFFRFNGFRFNGETMTLFGITVLLVILPSVGLGIAATYMGLALKLNVDPPLWTYLVFIVFFFCLAMAQALYWKWLVNFFYGSKRIASDVRVWHAGLFVFGQIMLVIVTLGLYFPMAILRVHRYFAKTIVLGEDTVEDGFGFTMSPWRDYFYILGQMLLAVVTLGVYAAWAYAKVATRILTQTYVESHEECKTAMPPAE